MKCDTCDARFSCAGNLKAHKKTHLRTLKMTFLNALFSFTHSLIISRNFVIFFLLMPCNSFNKQNFFQRKTILNAKSSESNARLAGNSSPGHGHFEGTGKHTWASYYRVVYVSFWALRGSPVFYYFYQHWENAFKNAKWVNMSSLHTSFSHNFKIEIRIIYNINFPN